MEQTSKKIVATDRIVTDLTFLRCVSTPVTLEEGRKVGVRLVGLLKKNQRRWAGVAACQLGESVRVVATKINSKITYLVNPEITKFITKPEEFNQESCLSFLGRRFKTLRSQKIEITATNLESPMVVFGFEAVCIQHEINHLDGLIVPDYGEEIKVTDPIKRAETKVGRNEPCPCGSGKKYKKCCIKK